MATVPTVRTLSAATVDDIDEMRRRVLGRGGSTAITPYGGALGTLYFVPDSQIDDGTNVSRWNYTGKLFTTPNGTTPISTTAVKARNIFEARNETGVRAGLSVNPSATACNAVIGIQPARPKVPYLVIGKQVIASVTYYLFVHQNDPIIKGP